MKFLPKDIVNKNYIEHDIDLSNTNFTDEEINKLLVLAKSFSKYPVDINNKQKEHVGNGKNCEDGLQSFTSIINFYYSKDWKNKDKIFFSEQSSISTVDRIAILKIKINSRYVYYCMYCITDKNIYIVRNPKDDTTLDGNVTHDFFNNLDDMIYEIENTVDKEFFDKI